MPKITWKGSVQLSPLPAVLVTSKSGERENVFTVAWTGVACTQPPKVYISVRPERYSHELISESGEFVINLTTEKMVRAVDYCGVKSGRDIDKFEKCSLEREAGETVAAPVLKDSPLALECRVCEVLKLGSHDMFLADVTAVRTEESMLDEAGRLCLERSGLVAYTHGEYRTLGKKLLHFGESVRKKRTLKKKKPSHGRKK